jgi:hypothetical protein
MAELVDTIKEAKFIQALANNGGSIKEAYKVISPNSTEKALESNGSRFLSKISQDSSFNINKVLKDIKATPDLVLPEALRRAERSKKPSDYLNTVKFLAKLGNWGEQKDIFAGLKNDIDTEVIDIVRVRLKKSRKESRDLAVERNKCQVADIVEASNTKDTTVTQ